MSQQAQSQQQNAHHPNHLKDQEDQQQEPSEDDQLFRQQKRPPFNNQRYIFQRDQTSLTQNQSITNCREQQHDQQSTTDQSWQLFGWQEGQTTQHVIDAHQTDKQADTYDREEDEPNHVDQHQQRVAGRQEEQEQQWAQQGQGQHQYEDQAAAAERGRQEQLLVGMEDDLSFAQRHQLARFLQQQIDQIGREE